MITWGDDMALTRGTSRNGARKRDNAGKRDSAGKGDGGRKVEGPRTAASRGEVDNNRKGDGGGGARAMASTLLSDEPTLELVVRAQQGDRGAVEALLQRALPALKRWAHGRLPAAARGSLDTGDLVQDSAMHVLRRLDVFQPHHVGAMQAYLRQSVINRIRDEVRRIGRQPPPVELPDYLPDDRTSPLEFAMQSQAYERYRGALMTLTPRERELIVARIEMQWRVPEIAERFGFRTVDAARMAVTRAVKRLTVNLANRSS